MKDIKVRARPKLNTPNFVAAWPGIGNVSMIVASYLLKNLNFRHLAEINAPTYFDPIGVMVYNSVIEAPQFPQSHFYYWKNQPGRSDLILFVGDDQPASRHYDLAGKVLDVANYYGVKRVYTCAAALSRIHYTEIPRAWGVATTPDLVAELASLNLVHKGGLQIAGLNGILLGTTKERQMDGICLLGEVPVYASKNPNPLAALSVMRALAQLTEIDIDLTEMEEAALESREKMKQMASEAMGEYIDYFTTPIWEQDEDGEEGDEDDEEDDEEEENENEN